VKGREGARSIPMSPDLVARVRRHVSEQSVAALDGWLFTAPRGGRVRYDNWRTRVWDRVVEVAGIGDVNPHDLRHSCATRLFTVDRWGVPEAQSFMGHADPTVTLRVYTHIAAESLPAPTDGHFADTLQQ
jgi:integrase